MATRGTLLIVKAPKVIRTLNVEWWGSPTLIAYTLAGIYHSGLPSDFLSNLDSQLPLPSYRRIGFDEDGLWVDGTNSLHHIPIDLNGKHVNDAMKYLERLSDVNFAYVIETSQPNAIVTVGRCPIDHTLRIMETLDLSALPRYIEQVAYSCDAQATTAPLATMSQFDDTLFSGTDQSF